MNRPLVDNGVAIAKTVTPKSLEKPHHKVSRRRSSGKRRERVRDGLG